MRMKKVAVMKQGVDRFINRQTKTGKKFYDRFFIYVPTEVGRDAIFPFKAGEKVNIKIKNNKLIIEKRKQNE